MRGSDTWSRTGWNEQLLLVSAAPIHNAVCGVVLSEARDRDALFVVLPADVLGQVTAVRIDAVA